MNLKKSSIRMEIDRQLLDPEPGVRGAGRHPRHVRRPAHPGARPLQQGVYLRRSLPHAAVRIEGGDPGPRQAAPAVADTKRGVRSRLRPTHTPKKPTMNHTHLTAPTRHVDVDGAQFAYRRWGYAATDQPPLFFLQHFRGGMDHWDPLMTDGLAAGREVIDLKNSR